MNELHLFAGVGGGILGGMLLGHRTVCAVEIEPYCRKVLFQRQRDGILPWFPIWDDVKTFDGKPWRGIVDIVCGGFPCQDLSCAGKGAGITGSRSGLWSEMSRIIGEVRPRYAFVENVPTLVGRGLALVLSNLADMGYDAKWGIVGADDVGAPHRRKRVWIMAKSNGLRLEEYGLCNSSLSQRSGPSRTGVESGKEVDDVADSPQRQEDGRERGDLDGTTGGREGIDTAADFGGQDVADTSQQLLDRTGNARPGRGIEFTDGGSWWASDPADTECIHGDDAGHGTGEVCGECESSEICGLSRWGLKSRLGRVSHGIPDRIHRLKALGNAQIPIVVATAWRILTR
jgi:DNA (cytosine-5)-methyltransferase 1